MIVDSHCHLDDAAFSEDLDAVVERAREAGVGLMLSIGTGDGPPDLEADTAGPWVPSDWSAWAVPQSNLTSGSWITLAFDLATAPALVIGSGVDLSQVRFIGLQSLDAGSGTIILKWDNIRSVP